MGNYFYRVPNKWIREKPPDMKRICTYYLINLVRGISDYGMTSIKYIIDSCGYKTRHGKDGINRIYMKIISEAVQQQDIILDDGYKISNYTNVDTAIPYIVNSINFDEVDNFTKLTEQEFDTIIKNNPSRNRENILGVYLYIKSYYHPYTSVNRPIGFYQNLDTIRKSLNISERVLIKLLNWLVDQKLLIKHYTGSILTDNPNKPRKNVPNIYIPNLGQSQEEIDETIKSTIAAMKDYYGVDEFLPFMQNLKEE